MPDPKRRTRLDQDERRAQIIAAALMIFARRSVDDVSSAELAAAAGVSRGLLNHYFRTKRDLYVAAIETLVDLPAVPLPAFREGASVEERIHESVEAWLELVERNGPAWLAATSMINGAYGADVNEIIERARDRAVGAIVEVAGLSAAAAEHPEVRSVLRGYAQFADALVREWLGARRISREQAAVALDATLCHLVRTVVPAVTTRT